VRAQKSMLRLASETSGADHTWADEIFAAIWMNPTHKNTLDQWVSRG
jgi:hypothetical protein